MIINTKFIIFNINNTLSIIIKNLCVDGDHLYKFDPIAIVFKDKKAKYTISQNDYLLPELENFYFFLKGVIKRKQLLPKSINADLGYLWNKYLHQNSISSCEQSQKNERWIGAEYLMWEAKKFDTWMYNYNNNIYLEITPRYPWHYSQKTKNKKFVPFDEWIKNYKPLALIEINKAIAQQWLEQTKIIMKEIEKSDEKYLHTPQDEVEE